ncbi:MAG: EAL domain-containing protein, partial [Gammaproteobacteria bacterium]|nr:EAL domain-containing protein [Gammaproteobacteria bacterium]
ASREREERGRLPALAFEHITQGVMITDSEGRLVHVNPAFTAITGYAASEVRGRTLGFLSSGKQDKDFYRAMWDAITQQGRWSGKIWNRLKTGETQLQWLDVVAMQSPGKRETHYLGVLSDFSKVERLEAQLQHQALYDSLTRLPNRQFLETRMRQAIAQAERHGHMLAVLFIDIDQFKIVNDSLGHTFGDRLIQVVAERLSRFLRAEDTLARPGGDEFIVLMPRLENPAGASALAERLLKQFTQPFEIDGKLLHLGASIGIALYPVSGTSPEDLLRHADSAMYAAKDGLTIQDRKHPGNYLFYCAPGAASLRHYLQLRRELEQALERREFVLYYQPVVELSDRNIVAVEALVRWQHPQRGLCLPGEFIPLAEQTRQIIEIGDWVIQEACRQWSTWSAAGRAFNLSVNLSPRQFESQTLLTNFRRCLDAHPLDPKRLEFEITETALMEKTPAMHRFIDACREMGITFSIDDFGTGYSSLIYLEELPVTSLKIDQRFVAGMLENKKDQTIVKTIIDMGHAMELTVIAEGVETEKQFLRLRELGCDRAQGYWFGRPMPIAEFERYIGTSAANSGNT